MAIPCNVQPGFNYTVYPCAIDSSNQLPITVDNKTPVKAEVVNRHREAILAIEAELGVNPSATFTTVRARLDALEALVGSGGGGAGIDVVKKDNISIVSNVRSLNFIGSSVNITDAGDNQANVTITAVGGAIQVQETRPVTTNGQTVFNLTDIPIDDTAVLMFLNGIKQQYGPDYTVSNAIVTYNNSPSLLTTDVVEFWYIISGNVTQVQESIEVESIGQTSFMLSAVPSSGSSLMMFINGLKYQNGIDYSVSDDEVTYLNSTELETDDIVEFWYISSGGGGGGGGGGSQTLADTLSLGNLTGGNNIVLSSGDKVSSLDDAVYLVNGMVTNALNTSPLSVSSGDALFWAMDDLEINPMFSDENGDRVISTTIEEAITTGDNTPTIIQTIPVYFDVAYIETIVLAKDQGSNDCAAYKRSAKIKVVSGTPSIESLQTDYTSEDDFGWDCVIGVDGNDVVVIVTGASSTDIAWKVSTKLEVM